MPRVSINIYIVILCWFAYLSVLICSCALFGDDIGNPSKLHLPHPLDHFGMLSEQSCLGTGQELIRNNLVWLRVCWESMGGGLDYFKYIYDIYARRQKMCKVKRSESLQDYCRAHHPHPWNKCLCHVYAAPFPHGIQPIKREPGARREAMNLNVFYLSIANTCRTNLS